MSNFLNNVTEWDIQTIRPQATPFALLGLNPSYELDATLLERHYLILQKELHPDRFINKPVEGRTAEMMSAWINKAYTTLKDPVLRAQALLKIKGCSFQEDQISQEPTILEEALEWRQRLQEIEVASQQETLLQDLKETVKKCEDDFNNAWENQDEQNLKRNFLRLSYLIKTLQETRKKSFYPVLQRA